MARALRVQYDGAVYHVTSRGNERRPVFRDRDDRKTLLDILEAVNQRYSWLCHAYCLMNNHYHLVIETVDGELSAGMRQLNGVYTQRFNHKYDRAGHLFQGRFKAILIEKENYLLEVCRYVVLNPVRASVVERPSEWDWSSYNATRGRVAPHPALTTDWVLSQFGVDRLRAQAEYQRFVQDGIGGGNIWGEARARGILGSGDFLRRMTRHLKGQKGIKEIPRRQRLVDRPGLAELFSAGRLATRTGRNQALRRAVEEFGYRQIEIADYLGLHYSTVSRLLDQEISKGKT